MTDNIKIRRMREPELKQGSSRKLARTGAVYYEIHIWTGAWWDMLDVQPRTLDEARAIVKARGFAV